jgi:hypothetical protein
MSPTFAIIKWNIFQLSVEVSKLSSHLFSIVDVLFHLMYDISGSSPCPAG